MEIYACRDNKTGIFNVPQFFRSPVEATRSFIVLSRNQNTMVHQFPGDFDLMRMGTWDELQNKWSMLDTPVLIMTGKNAKEVRDENNSTAS